jgi:hypothetical protein
MLHCLDFQSFRIFFHDPSASIYRVMSKIPGSVHRTILTAVQLLRNRLTGYRGFCKAEASSAIVPFPTFHWEDLELINAACLHSKVNAKNARLQNLPNLENRVHIVEGKRSRAICHLIRR